MSKKFVFILILLGIVFVMIILSAYLWPINAGFNDCSEFMRVFSCSYATLITFVIAVFTLVFSIINENENRKNARKNIELQEIMIQYERRYKEYQQIREYLNKVEAAIDDWGKGTVITDSSRGDLLRHSKSLIEKLDTIDFFVNSTELVNFKNAVNEIKDKAAGEKGWMHEVLHRPSVNNIFKDLKKKIEAYIL
jgi:hypothetical protein